MSARDYCDDDECRCCAERNEHQRNLFDKDAPVQGDLFGLTHRSTWPSRLERDTNRAEGVFYRRWVERQKTQLVLQHILRGEDDGWLEPTDRDSIVAASVVQWFGTSVGRSFISGCERELGWKDSMVYRPYNVTADDRSRARSILSPLRTVPGYEAACDALAAQLQKIRWDATTAMEDGVAAIRKEFAIAVRAAESETKAAKAETERIRKDAIFGFESGERKTLQRGIALKRGG